MSPIDTIVAKLKKISCCEGIIFAGSRNEGDHNEDSDYDFTVLISSGKSYYKIFKYKNYTVDVCVATFEVIKKQDLVRDRLSNAELYIIASGQILFDEKGNAKRLQKLAKAIWLKGPKQIITKQHAGYQCSDFLHKLQKDKTGTAYFLLNSMMIKTVTLFFELNNSWLPKSSVVESTMKKIDKHFFELYISVTQTVGSDHVEVAIKLLEYLIKKFDLPKTGEFYSKKD